MESNSVRALTLFAKQLGREFVCGSSPLLSSTLFHDEDVTMSLWTYLFGPKKQKPAPKIETHRVSEAFADYPRAGLRAPTRPVANRQLSRAQATPISRRNDDDTALIDVNTAQLLAFAALDTGHTPAVDAAPAWSGDGGSSGGAGASGSWDSAPVSSPSYDSGSSYSSSSDYSSSSSDSSSYSSSDSGSSSGGFD